MVQRKLQDWQKLSWQNQIRAAIRDPAQLFRLLDLPAEATATGTGSQHRFRLCVPHAFVARMRKRDAEDPLLLQVLPTAAEDRPVPGYHHDPVADLDAIKVPGLIQKYQGRALLIATGACAVHCRYCFRQHFPYADNHARASHWDLPLDSIMADKSINEVILSGGDPLSLDDEELTHVIERLSRIRHVHRLRIHSRLPIIIPARMATPFWQWLPGLKQRITLVVHANHANEIDGNLISACRHLKGGGITLLNQSVLLRRVNDRVDTLKDLSEKLFEAGILPYYLHILDKVAGAAHFDVPIDRARSLIRQLQNKLPGFLVPRLVQEQIGAARKVLL